MDCTMTSQKHTDVMYLPEVDLAYLAGFIDGEGCLSSDCNKGRHKARLSIGNNDKDILDWIKSVLGGNVYAVKRLTMSGKQTYIWAVTCKKAILAIETIMPYMKSKRDEAEVFVKYRNADPELCIEIDKELRRLKRL